MRVPGYPPVSVAAQSVGAPRNGAVPLRLKPLDPSHVAELSAFIDEVSPSIAPPPPPDTPRDDDVPSDEENTLTLPLRAAAGPPAAPQDPKEWAKTDPTFGRHPADADGVSVVFGNEPTTPGTSVSSGPVGVVVRDPTDDGETLPLPTQSAPGHAMAGSLRTSRRMRIPPPSNVPLGRVIANKYRVESLIGAGAVGAVYRASHADLGRTVAIKVLHPSCRADPHLLSAFRKEARAASALAHPNVTIVHDFGEEPDGLVYIVMEHLHGITLQTAIDQDRRLAPKRAVGIMLQVCAALSAAHERGIVHRDVKPDNVLLVQSRDDEGYPFELAKVCDFGIAALEAGPSPASGELTAGTPEYMAPEQARGQADARTDIYACGVMLYEMLAGRPPFVADTVQGILTKHAEEPAPRLSAIVTVDARLEALISRALEKGPERRFQAMREMRQALKRLQT